MKKYNQALILTAMAVLTACASHGTRGEATSPTRSSEHDQRSGTDAAKTAEQNKRVVREFFRVFSTGNVPAILATMRDDATWWVSGSLQGFSGEKTKAQLAEVLAGVGDLYVSGSLPLTPSTVVAEGDLVFAEASGRAELKNGRVYEPTSVFVFRIENGLIVQVKEYMDTLHSHAIWVAQ